MSKVNIRQLVREEIQRAEKRQLINTAKLFRAIVKEEMEVLKESILSESSVSGDAIEEALSQSRMHRLMKPDRTVKKQVVQEQRAPKPTPVKKSINQIEAEIAGGQIASALDSGVDLSRFGIG